MACWIKKHSHTLLWLKIGHCGAQLGSAIQSNCQVVYGYVDVHHHLLLPLRGGPYWSDVVRRSVKA